jgi:hypothetical protein
MLFIWSWAIKDNFRILVVPLNKALLLFFFAFFGKFWIYSTVSVFTPHIYFKILISMITGNLVEIRLPTIQSRKCLRKYNLWGYKAENFFGSIISGDSEQTMSSEV